LFFLAKEGRQLKIKNIYLNKKTPVISIAIALLCVSITLISQLVPSTFMAFTFSYPVKYPWQLLTYVFLQGIPGELFPPDFPYSSMELTIGHLGYNLLLILPFGILVEKVIGSKRFLALFASTWIVDVILNFIMGVIYTKDGESFAVSGASGIAFSFMPVGIYILCVMAKRYGFGKLFRQVLFYLLMGIAIPTMVISLMPDIAGVAGIPSMIIHLIAIVIGIVFAVIFKGKTVSFFDGKMLNNP
jgi:membrane associated rhomboid family serine protease